MPKHITTTSLFVYGSLRHDQPDHGRFCRGLLGWRPARVRGRLYQIPSGYPLVAVPAAAALAHATSEPAFDEVRRRAVPTESVALAFMTMAGEPWYWIEGELLQRGAPARAWPPLDAWEDFVPGRSSLYARCLIPVQIEDDDGPQLAPAWAYVATATPAGSTEIPPDAPPPAPRKSR